MSPLFASPHESRTRAKSSIMATATAHVTPDELLVMPDGKDFELVDGQLVERHVSRQTSYMAATLIRILGQYIRDNGLGYVFGPDCGYQCFPHEPRRVRKPDLSFISASRIPQEEIDEEGWFAIAPDLAVEIVSPNDVAEELQQKLEDYRSADIPVVWVVYPQSQVVDVYRPDGTTRLRPPIELVGEGPLAGFRCKYEELLPSTTTANERRPGERGP